MWTEYDCGGMKLSDGRLAICYQTGNLLRFRENWPPQE